MFKIINHEASGFIYYNISLNKLYARLNKVYIYFNFFVSLLVNFNQRKIIIALTCVYLYI